MGDFKKLVAWQKAHAFALAVHAAFKGTKSYVSPGLRGQILRAVEFDFRQSRRGLRAAKPARTRSLCGHGVLVVQGGREDLIKSRDLGILERSLSEDLLAQGDEVARLCFGLTRTPPKRPDPRFGEPEV